MEQDEKLCPYCAEPIKAEAIRCKHCHADLSQKIVIPEGRALPSDKSKGTLGKVILWIILALVLAVGGLMVIGALSGPPTAQAQARDAIDLCWKDFDDPSKSANTREFVRSTCHSMIDKFESQYGRSATLRRD